MTPHSTSRWRSRPILSTILSVTVLAIPLVASVAAAVGIGHLLSRRGGVVDLVLWWSAVLGASTVVFLIIERSCRRFLPLVALLKMTMLFPDQAPKRLRVAWRAASVRDLERHSTVGISRVPADAAGEILVLAASLSRHDRATRGHSERVRALTDMIANELGLADLDRDRLRWSALLHDVGKLTVHPETLNKQGQLTEEEWQQVRSHPLEGRRLISPLASWLGEWSLAIEQHHESFDGSGYPFGLSGSEISLAARIVTVADAFDVMTSGRSYKKALSTKAARKELTQSAGTQFDPVIVRAFLDVSLGRLRWTVSPVSWIADLPFVARLGAAAHTIAAAGQIALGASALTVGGILAAHVPTHHLVRLSASAPSVRPYSAGLRGDSLSLPQGATTPQRAEGPHSRAKNGRTDFATPRFALGATQTSSPADLSTTPDSSPAGTSTTDPSITSSTLSAPPTTTGPSPSTTTTQPPPTTIITLPLSTTTTQPGTTTTTTQPLPTTTIPPLCLLRIICL